MDEPLANGVVVESAVELVNIIVSMPVVVPEAAEAVFVPNEVLVVGNPAAEAVFVPDGALVVGDLVVLPDCAGVVLEGLLLAAHEATVGSVTSTL